MHLKFTLIRGGAFGWGWPYKGGGGEVTVLLLSVISPVTHDLIHWTLVPPLPLRRMTIMSRELSTMHILGFFFIHISCLNGVNKMFSLERCSLKTGSV